MDLISRTVVELGSSVPNADVPLMETGLDSIAATELSSRLGSVAGVELSSTLAFDQPTPRAMIKHVLELIEQSKPGAQSTWHKRHTSTAPPIAAQPEAPTNALLRISTSQRRAHVTDLIQRTLVDLGTETMPDAD
eukprot:4081021-Prymnesium_polylepis.1